MSVLYRSSTNPCSLLVTGVDPNILRQRQNGRHFAEVRLKLILLNESDWIIIQMSLELVPDCSSVNKSELISVMFWRRTGDKPLLELVVA